MPASASGESGAGRARRGLIAVGVAVVLGLIAGLIVVIAVNGDARRAGATENPPRSEAGPGPVQTLRDHFDRLEQGRFLAASDDLTPDLLDSLGGRTIWVSGRIADLLIDAQLDARALEQTESAATVRVDSLRTESLGGGCTGFSGTYSLVRSGDRWLISSADLTDRPC